MTKPGIAAYYQCYKDPYATIQSVKHYRKSYPDNTLYLLSDNGYDYSALAKEYNCIYEHSTVVHGGYPSLTRVEDVELFITRLKKALNHIEEEWVMLLEDDVKVFGPYDMDLLKNHMNGINIGGLQHITDYFNQQYNNKKSGNRLCGKLLNDFIRLFNPHHLDDLHYSGWGGTVLNVSFFRESLKNDGKIYKSIKFLWENTSIKLYVTDLILSFICFSNGGTIGPLIEACEIGQYHPSAKSVNFDKSWCGIPVPPEDAHLVKL
jgi:hypothetical protein